MPSPAIRTIFLALALAVGAAAQAPPGPGSRLQVRVSGPPTEPIVFAVRILDEDDRSPRMAAAGSEFDHRRTERAYVFVVRRLASTDDRGAEFDVECERILGLITHPINVREEIDTDDPVEPGSEPFQVWGRQADSVPLGAVLHVRTDASGRIERIDGADRLTEIAKAERVRLGVRESPLSALRVDEKDLRALLEPLFPALPADGILTAGAIWKTRGQLGTKDRFEDTEVEITEGWAAADAQSVYLEGAVSGGPAKLSPTGSRRSVVSLADGLPDSVDWTLRLERSTVEGAGRTVTGEVRRFRPAAADRWIAELTGGGDLDATLDDLHLHRKRVGPFLERAMALLEGPPARQTRVLQAVAAAGATAAPLVARLTSLAADEAANVETRRRAFWTIRSILEDLARAARREALAAGTASAPTSRPAQAAANAARDALLARIPDLLGNSNAAIRAEAAWTAGTLRREGRAVRLKILAQLEADTDPAVLGSLAWAAARMEVDDPAFARPLARMLAGPDPKGADVVLNATWALSVLGAKAGDALEALIEALDTTNERALGNVLATLEALGPKAKAAVPKLQELRRRQSAEAWIPERVDAVLKAIGP